MGLLDTLGAVAAWATKSARAVKDIAASFSRTERASADVVSQDEGPVFEHCVLPPAQVNDLHDLYMSAKSVCSLLDQSDMRDFVSYSGHALEEIFENDAVRYLLYLSAKDDELTKAEAEFLNVIFECDRTVGEWTIRAIRLGVTSPAMPTDVPLSIQILNQAGSRCGVDAGDVFVPVFDRLGSALMVADGEETAEERECADAYMRLLMDHLGSGAHELMPPAYPIFLN